MKNKSNRINMFNKIKQSARKCGVTGLELRALVDRIIEKTKENK